MWASDETNLFCEILADPVKNFMENLEREALKKHSAVNYLITLLQNLKKAPKTLKQKKERNQIYGQSGSVSLKNLVIKV